MLTMTATPPGDWLSSVIALTLAAACDQPDGCYSCSLFFYYFFFFINLLEMEDGIFLSRLSSFLFTV